MTATPEPTSSLASSSPTTTTIIYSSSAKFPLGQIVATPGAFELLQETGFSAAALCRRHVQCDWGDICEEDRAENDFAITRRLRIQSCYRLVDAERLAATPRDRRSSLPTLWIITEADRSVTTLLRPDEY
ncbi:type I restriction endonuclease subunit M [Acidovorax radicis]|uniref:type I restriction endonuclease subunit M n=1 Tax=Acidovorax radicis TaxID=758826 RepID=UPI001CFC295E|nr:type I restriction endonuclease subunit M [Acidovorax radicis]